MRERLTDLRQRLLRLPLVSPTASWVQGLVVGALGGRFPGASSYWEQRYAAGGTSGAGSYGRLAEFKADVLNRFVRDRGVTSVLEFGCGDGNQLSMAHYPCYVGLDVSKTAIELCKARFASDESKSFFLYDPDAFVDRTGVFRAELCLSLDVLFHLVDERVFDLYLSHLFSAATSHVIIYSTDVDRKGAPHVQHRAFTPWVERNQPNWRLCDVVKNPYPVDPSDPSAGSPADFFVFERRA